MDALHIQGPVDWVGDAWGGHVGIVFADNYPSRCGTLTTIGTRPYPLTASERRQNALLVHLHKVVGPRPFSRIMVEALAGKGVATPSHTLLTVASDE